MRKKMLRVAGILCLSVVLCIRLVGCSGKKNEQSVSPDVQMSNENGRNEDIETSGENGSNGTVGNREETADSSTESNNVVESSSGMSDNSKEEGVFYDGANLSGRVVDFSDTGFTITPRTLIIME